MTILWFLLFLLAAALTVISAEVFTAKAEDTARAGKWSPFITAVVLTVFGVSLPELLISIFASAQDYSSMVPTTVSGANLINLLLIPGVLAFSARPLVLKKERTLSLLPWLFGCTLLLLVTGYDGRIELWEGIILFLNFLVFMWSRWENRTESGATGPLEIILEKLERLWHFGHPNQFFPILMFSFVTLLAGSYLTVRAVVEISEIQNWNPGYLASGLVALAVSVPELLFAIRANKKGWGDLAITTLIISCVLNSTLVLAIPSFIGSLNVLDDVISISFSFLLFSVLFFTLIAFQRQWSRPLGALLILINFVFFVQFLNPLFS